MADLAERRSLAFNSLEEAVVDAEKLASGQVRTAGKHSFGQILNHLALSLDMSSGKIQAPRPPLFMRLIMPLIKGMILNGSVKPGFKLPKASEDFFWPDRDFDVSQNTLRLQANLRGISKERPARSSPCFW